MFGMISGMFSKSKSPAPNNESITIPPIRVSDYIGTASTLSEVKGVGNGPIITKDLLSLFNDKSTDKHQLFLDGVIGKNNGSFPVTNPVKDNVYFYAVERKYYKCNKSSSGVVNAPDVNFSEFSLSNFKGGVSGINITGAATGSGKLDEATGIMTVNTTVNWANITGKPSTLPNPNGLVIKLNGTAQTTYTGANPVELNITAASIGAQAAGSYAPASHNHDSSYSKLGHNHDDLYFTETEINNKLAGYQPKGDYATTSHNHDSVYSKLSHNHDGVYQPKGSYALSSHQHSLSSISVGEFYTTGSVHPLMATFVSYCRGNKLFGINPKDITVEYSKDGGKSWLDYGLSDEAKAGLFTELNNEWVSIGKANTKELNVAQGINSRLRITISATTTRRYVSINKTYIWFSSSGNTCKCSCKVLKGNGNTDNWTTIWDNKDAGGWSGGNFFNHQYYAFQGPTASSESNCLKVRYEFWMTSINSDYEAGSVGFISGYGDNAWVSESPFVSNDHLYKWDTGYNMLLPAGLEAQGEIKGVVTKAKQDEQGNVIHTTYAKTSHNHSGVYAPASHNHTSGNITALTGYSKPSSTSVISATDNLNTAIGKLEKALDGKAPTGNYAVVGHNHNDVYNTKSEITDLLAGKLGATANAVSASKLATARTISLSGAVSGSSTFDGSANMNVSVSLNGFDAGKITSGTISVDRLPKTALSEFIPVANKAARLALTKSEAQNGDTVKEADTKRMYLVTDDTKLNSEEGYQEYTTVVDWSVITGKPSKFPAESHVHTWDQINGRPSTLPNPNGLTISLNGTAQTVYTGASAVAFNITPASIGAQVAGSYASASHNHDGVYQPKGSYATSDHNHDSVYSKLSHSHTWDNITGKPDSFAPSAHNQAANTITAMTGYSKASSVAAIDATDSLNVAIGKLERALDSKQPSGSYAQASHTHSEYQAKGDYALASHNHDTVYAKSSHAHSWESITGRPGSFTPSAHNQASSTITAMTGYEKPSSTSAIVVGDTLNAAIGKLEKALDGKQAAGSYALASHNHSGVYAPVSHNHTASNITSLTGYKKGETGAAIGETDTLLIAIGKLEKALDGKQVAGSYASSSHNHDGKYQPAGSYAAASHNHDTQYAAKSHGHAWGDLSGIPSSFTPTAHNQASSTITTMTGYTKAASVAAIDATDSLNVAIGKLEKALDGKQAAGSYAASNHNHSGVYAAASHSHAWDAITGKPGSFAPSAHNQAANTITAMTGYSKPSSTSAIATTDTLIVAIGKLEKALDGKQVAGSYATASHNHDGVYQPKGSYALSDHNHSGVYAPVSHGNHVPATQTVDNKIFLRCDNTWHTITPAEIGAQPAGSYAAANHTHNEYAATSHTHPYLPTSGGTISGALTVTGQILSNADVVAYSDARMKTNVVKIESALDKVSKISGYTYDMQGVEFGGQRQAGVLAQELKEVLPEAVVTDDNGYYAVRYTNIIPLLIEALKEEKSKRESLEDEVMSLKEENKTLQERLAKIERMLDIK